MARTEEYKITRDKLTPKKMRACKRALQALGAKILEDRGNSFKFMHNCRIFEVWPFTEGWRGGGLPSGKGLENLYKVLKNEN